LNRPLQIADTDGDSSYFARLRSRMAKKPSLGAQVMVHINYLAEKAGVNAEELLSGRQFRADRAVLKDAKTNIDAVLDDASQRDRTPADYIDAAEKTLQGWCTREKANFIAESIVSEKPSICVEIGIFGGRSIVPAAAALKWNGKGAIYGIETWRPEVADEHATNEVNDTWWQNIDFHTIKTDFYRFVATEGLASQIRVIEAPAADAAHMFTAIDYLHIDGGHSTYNSSEDVVLYAKKVRSGGIIILDDTNWPTVAPAMAILASIGEKVTSFPTADGSPDACTVYRKR
jgi:predicted O-methyltransferase YrrM